MKCLHAVLYNITEDKVVENFKCDSESGGNQLQMGQIDTESTMDNGMEVGESKQLSGQPEWTWSTNE